MPVESESSTTYVRKPFALWGLSVLLGAAFGAATNVSNSVISPTYFRRVMGWSGDVVGAAVLQGALEGAITGCAFGIAVAVAATVVTKLKCRPGALIGVLPLAFVVAFAFWLLGGMIGAVSARVLAPVWLWAVPFAPRAPMALVRFGWVGGSIWGAYLGSVIGLICSVVMLRRRWRAVLNADQGFDVIRPVVAVYSAGENGR